MDDVMQALAQPTRREILQLILEEELSAGEIAAHFEVSRPAISQHIKALRDTNLVFERRDGTRRMYRARPEGMSDLRKFLDLFWDYRLNLLKDEVEAAEEQKRTDSREGDVGSNESTDHKADSD
jgi:DNA-binding transcriptional ArsR family regulator